MARRRGAVHGDGAGIETKLVPEAGFPLDLIRVGQLKNVSLARGLGPWRICRWGWRDVCGCCGSSGLTVVVGVGGYASGPAMLAAVLLGLPTLAYEPNAVPGLVNRRVGKVCERGGGELCPD